MVNTSQSSLVMYKIIALIGVVIMGIGSFMSCLSASHAFQIAGNVILVISLVITGYGFYRWQP